MRQNKLFIFNAILMQMTLEACSYKMANLEGCEKNDSKNWIMQDSHCYTTLKHCENNQSFSMVKISKLPPYSETLFVNDYTQLIKLPELKRKCGLLNLLQADYSLLFTNVPVKVGKLPLVVEFLNYMAERYLRSCMSILLYDNHYETVREFILWSLLLQYPVPHVHGRISRLEIARKRTMVEPPGGMCRHFVLLLQDLSLVDLVGNHSISHVVVVTEVPVADIQEFLSSGVSHGVVNILVVSPGIRRNKEPMLVLRTHDLHSGGTIRLLTSWRRGGLTRDVNLFPDKMRRGFNGQSFIVAASDQPHYVIHRNVSDDDASGNTWDGLEVRLLRLLSQTLNFKLKFRNFPATDRRSGQASGVVQELMSHRAHIGVAGFYTSSTTMRHLTLSAGHSIDCATFITRTSTALPRYRAIMGPFHWSVWLMLTLTYLFAIFPVAFSHHHTLTDLLKNPWQMENMFWYVFGTFTNCFTFSGKHSWTSTDKTATRMFIGTYWMFSIIVTACYTGSIIAFVTLPLYPQLIDSARQVYEGGFKVAMLDGEGWQDYFNNSHDPIATKVLKKVEHLVAIEDGLRNLTKWRNSRYAVFGSRDKLDFILRANFTHGESSKRAFLHIAKQCFVPFHVAIAFPRRAPHSDMLNQVLLRAVQSGLVLKLKREVDWEMRRSTTGRFLQASSIAAKVPTKPPDRMLSLDDVQGNFLLLGAGFAIAIFALFVEIVTYLLKKAFKKYCTCSARVRPPDFADASIIYETSTSQSQKLKDACEMNEERSILQK